MISDIYRSEKKPGAYIYLAEGKSFEDVPEELMRMLGVCTHSMSINLAEREKLASEDIKLVIENLKTQGYHFQIPPKINSGVIKYGA